MNIAVFKTGKHTDMKGQVQQWTDADLDRIISAYDPAKHEAPAVIGHPKNNDPAFGWVKKLSRIGGTLYAEFDQLNPDFLDMLKAGSFKKRSISLYPDMTLKHVGFLGAVPPAVKGLPDYQFADDENDIVIEFSSSIKEKKQMEMKEFFEALKFWKEATTVETPAPALPPVQAVQIAPVMKELPAAVSFSEADMEAAKKQAAEDAAKAERAKVMAEFAETNRELQHKAHITALNAEVDQLILAGKAVPAWKKAGIVEFMAGLDAETEYQYSEDEDGKKNQAAWFRGFLANLPKVIEFSELAKSKTGLNPGDSAARMASLVDKKRTDNQGMSYAEALLSVQVEHPELALDCMN
jgi:hypothetical protein